MSYEPADAAGVEPARRLGSPGFRPGSVARSDCASLCGEAGSRTRKAPRGARLLSRQVPSPVGWPLPVRTIPGPDDSRSGRFPVRTTERTMPIPSRVPPGFRPGPGPAWFIVQMRGCSVKPGHGTRTRISRLRRTGAPPVERHRRNRNRVSSTRALRRAEGAGIEPAHDVDRDFGLANRRLTPRPTFPAAYPSRDSNPDDTRSGRAGSPHWPRRAWSDRPDSNWRYSHGKAAC
jgi:hypothetical protein